ncbi:hypothetical protein N1851_006796 [Merluccius polli]|uniref:Uncharacterized protein n=1 Tax=Merluccius polli TaxID=89951 RepID=A0AA47N507_MERPO|nr:hypothetical protein N1851_006796 [Merluccius polli]
MVALTGAGVEAERLLPPYLWNNLAPPGLWSPLKLYDSLRRNRSYGPLESPPPSQLSLSTPSSSTPRQRSVLLVAVHCSPQECDRAACELVLSTQRCPRWGQTVETRWRALVWSRGEDEEEKTYDLPKATVCWGHHQRPMWRPQRSEVSFLTSAQ